MPDKSITWATEKITFFLTRGLDQIDKHVRPFTFYTFIFIVLPHFFIKIKMHPKMCCTRYTIVTMVMTITDRCPIYIYICFHSVRVPILLYCVHNLSIYICIANNQQPALFLLLSVKHSCVCFVKCTTVRIGKGKIQYEKNLSPFYSFRWWSGMVKSRATPTHVTEIYFYIIYW